MADITAIAAVAASYASSYLVKLRRAEFLELAEIAKPKVVYRRKKFHFFAFDGFVIYTSGCQDSDLPIRVIEAMEFSNEPWRT